MTYKMFIDDIRFCSEEDFVVVRSSAEAISVMKELACPSFISFDHDLGGEDTAMVVVKWLVERDLDENGMFIPPEFSFRVHSANPIGAKNIQGYLDSYFANKHN